MGHESKLHRKLDAKHVSVMPEEVLAALEVKSGEIVVDATYGQGGHSALLEKAAKIKLVALDADPVRSEASNGTSPAVITANFADLKQVAANLGIKEINKALFDLGWNRGQLSAGRGFSFMTDEPLDMSYGKKPRSGFTAAEILNTFTEAALADIFFGYGEERYARRIAKAVVERRESQPFSSTVEFVEVLTDAVPPAYRRGRLHPVAGLRERPSERVLRLGLAVHAVSTLTTYPELLSPFGENHMYIAALPVLAAFVALYLLRQHDALWTVGARGAAAAHT